MKMKVVSHLQSNAHDATVRRQEDMKVPFGLQEMV